MASIRFISRIPVAGPGQMFITWTPSPAPTVGYRIYFTQSNPGSTGVFDQVIGSGEDAGAGTVVGALLGYMVSGLAAGTWYVAVTAYNAVDGDGQQFEGDYSNVVTKVVT